MIELRKQYRMNVVVRLEDPGVAPQDSDSVSILKAKRGILVLHEDMLRVIIICDGSSMSYPITIDESVSKALLLDKTLNMTEVESVSIDTVIVGEDDDTYEKANKIVFHKFNNVYELEG